MRTQLSAGHLRGEIGPVALQAAQGVGGAGALLWKAADIIRGFLAPAAFGPGFNMGGRWLLAQQAHGPLGVAQRLNCRRTAFVYDLRAYLSIPS